MTPTIQAVVRTALEFVGAPYLWGAKGLKQWTASRGIVELSRPAFDCAGLYTFALFAANGQDLRFTHNTDALWNELPPCDGPRFGALAFYGGSAPNDVSHVVICLGGGMVVGAQGGGSRTLTFEAAAQQDAKVKILDSYRKVIGPATPFRGFRLPHLPLPTT